MRFGFSSSPVARICNDLCVWSRAGCAVSSWFTISHCFHQSVAAEMICFVVLFAASLDGNQTMEQLLPSTPRAWAQHQGLGHPSRLGPFEGTKLSWILPSTRLKLKPASWPERLLQVMQFTGLFIFLNSFNSIFTAFPSLKIPFLSRVTLYKFLFSCQRK